MSRTLRTAFTVATIALALTACSNPRPAPEVSAEAPATTETQQTADTPDTSEPATGMSDTTEAPAQPIDVAVTEPEAPTSASVPEHRRCEFSQAGDGGEYRVEGIKADDPDGGLTVRTYAGYSYQQIGLLLEGDVVGSYYDEVTMPSCLITRDGNVWWEIHHVSLPAGGWVNARYLTVHLGSDSILADDHVDQPEEEADAHADCVIFYGDDQCVVVYYTAEGISFVEPYDTEAAGELHLACAYNGNTSACDVLAFVGPGDGIGNSLTQTPTEFLMDDCDNLTGINQKLACAELATRG